MAKPLPLAAGTKVRVRDDAPMYAEAGLGNGERSTRAGHTGTVSAHKPQPGYDIGVYFGDEDSRWPVCFLLSELEPIE